MKSTTHPEAAPGAAGHALRKLSKAALIDLVCDAMDCITVGWSEGDLGVYVEPRLIARGDSMPIELLRGMQEIEREAKAEAKAERAMNRR